MVFTSIKWTPTIKEKDHHLVVLDPYSEKWQNILSRLQVQHRFGNHILKDKGDKISFEYEDENYLVKKNSVGDYDIYKYKYTKKNAVLQI